MQRYCRYSMAAYIQLVNVCAWIAPNAVLLRHSCHWFEPFVAWSAFVSWTCWNTVFLIMLIDAHNCAPWLKGRISSSEGAHSTHCFHLPKSNEAARAVWCCSNSLLSAYGCSLQVRVCRPRTLSACFLQQSMSQVAVPKGLHGSISALPAQTYAAAYAGKRLDAIVMDAPIWYHAPKLVLWCILEALALSLSVWITRECPKMPLGLCLPLHS